MKRITTVVFPIRARIERSAIGRRRIWRSLCGRYRIVESPPERRGARPVVYLMTANACGWNIESRHRTRTAAEWACRPIAAARDAANQFLTIDD